MNKHRILKDPVLADRIEKDGYIILPFLNLDEIEHFKKLYKDYHEEDPEFFYKSYFSSDNEYKRKIEQEITNIFDKRLGHLFVNHRSFGGMFVIKPPMEKGHFTAHQDWSFTDEDLYPSYNMWSPLSDVDEVNGNINVLKGSHRFLKTIRGFNTPDMYDHLHEVIEPNMVNLPMKAGEVVIFYHGLVHGSTKNLNQNARVSLGLSVVQKEAPLKYHYFDSDRGKLEQYASDPEFYISYVDHRDEKPKTIKYLGDVDFKFERLTLEHLKSLISKNHGVFIEKQNDSSIEDNSSYSEPLQKKPSLMNKLRTLFD